MSDDSCSDSFLSNEDQYLDIRSPFESSEFQSSADTPTMENNPNVVIIDGEANEAARDTTAGVEQANAANCEEQDPFTKKKRKKTSVTWEHFREITLDNGTQMHECIHCGEKVKKFKDGTTTPMRRHINQFCPKLQHVKKGQLKLNVFPGNSESSSMVQNWKFDNTRMREVISHMVMVHELPFNLVEYELFNVVMKEAKPAFTKISCATVKQDSLEFKEVFASYADRETTYKTLPSDDDWKKVEDVCSFLYFSTRQQRSEYPTSNLFLSELYGIKETLDSVTLNEDDCMKDMVEVMKIKFDKYWGSCNLLISVGTVLDPRYKMKLIDFSFKLIYSNDRALEEIQFVHDSLDELFKEYVESHKESNIDSSKSATVESGLSGSGSGSGSGASFMASRFGKDIKTGSAKYHQHIRSVDCVERTKMVDMLICGADWYRHYYGVHKKENKENDDVVYIELP
ncbi:hypothetical protein E3N88_38956 [Mikania micrantha]|uniref:BED-type domain-containing protein n=1 Tax=Mikania micrantha TaxID=192012 RepID=A0A5N6LVF0_9ASTR|nr:hypothetical protein E3N88_38956 [Mikania micrantha]